MRPRLSIFAPFLLTLTALLPVVVPEAAAAGAAELSLDRAGVGQWLSRALAAPVHAELPGGTVEIRLSAPGQVRFVDGGVEARIGVELPALRWRGHVNVRYETAVERHQGTVVFVPMAAHLSPALPLLGDVSRWLPRVPLPRSLGGEIELGDGTRLPMRAFVQGVRIDDERLHLQLGLDLR